MIGVLIGAVAAAAGSWLIGWSSAVAVGGLLGWFAPSGAAARRAGAAVLLGWMLVMAINAALGPVAQLASLLAAVIPVGAAGMVALTLAFGGLLGLTAGRVGALLRAAVGPGARAAR